MTAISKNVYFDFLDDIVHKYNNTIHRTIKIKLIDVKANTYIDSRKEVNDKDPKYKAGDHIRISKYKNILYTLEIGQKKFLLLISKKCSSMDRCY